VDWGQFGQKLAVMARDLLAQDSLDATLHRITDSAVELVEGCDGAGILVLHDHQVETLAPTDSLVVDSDRLQAELGQGPCFDTAHSAEGERVFRITDLTEERPRWPLFAPRAFELGVGSMMGFLLFTDAEEFGALNFYSRKTGSFTADSEQAGLLLASHAAIAFSSARTHAQMEHAIATRHVIGEAMGILMGRNDLTEEQAFDVLRRYSQETNIKLREVARRVCDSGGVPRIPPGEPPFHDHGDHRS